MLCFSVDIPVCVPQTGEKDPQTKSGNFIPDHQPPNAMVPDDTPQNLYPHCKTCSSSQGGTIGAMKKKGEL